MTHIVDGWVYANNTTLGADDGIGVAAIMAVMEDKTLKHGCCSRHWITRDEERVCMVLMRCQVVSCTVTSL